MTDELPSALRDALGQVIADQRREWNRARELIEAQTRADFVELRSTVRDDVAARLASLRDGNDGAPGEPGRDADMAPIVTEFEQIKSVLAEHAGTLSRELTDKVNARLAEVKDGEPGQHGSDGKDGEPGQRGEPGPAGEIPDAPDYIAEMISRCVAYVAHGPASSDQLPAFVLNINAGADRAKKKTIVMRKDRDGNPVADVTED